MIPFFMVLLNYWGHASLKDYNIKAIVEEYFWQLRKYTVRYLQERYGVAIETNYWFPNWKPDRYETMFIMWDKVLIPQLPKDSVHAVITYDLNFTPPPPAPQLGIAGYA